jgi:hypothetical protein
MKEKENDAIETIIEESKQEEKCREINQRSIEYVKEQVAKRRKEEEAEDSIF